MVSVTQIQQDVSLALKEDLGSGDLTAALIPEAKQITARVICRERAVLAGTAWFDEVFRQLDQSIQIDWKICDGAAMETGDTVCVLEGSAAPVLSGERAALNFLQTLSGTATQASMYVQAVSDTSARILDTRKTIPGLRIGQKYAVTCGGASNHRVGLFDAILIKENHILAAGSITQALQQARALGKDVKIETEVETITQLQEALEAGASYVLLDNFSLQQLKKAVEINQGRARLEASGGVTLDTVLQIAETGVDDISVGTITKDVQAVDFSMRFSEPE